jgi:hypothetical protein
MFAKLFGPASAPEVRTVYPDGRRSPCSQEEEFCSALDDYLACYVAHQKLPCETGLRTRYTLSGIFRRLLKDRDEVELDQAFSSATWRR